MEWMNKYQSQGPSKCVQKCKVPNGVVYITFSIIIIRLNVCEDDDLDERNVKKKCKRLSKDDLDDFEKYYYI